MLNLFLTPVLWKYLYHYARKHQALGNGFGYGLVDPRNPQSVARTLSARYYKDGAEILVDRGWTARWANNTSTMRKISFVVRAG
ncbi:DNA-cytosine methyltransferase [Raoultella ornithinolytica]|nr:DNA-cytosine methyltransferase [Raoultella ornithinolytica]